MVLLKSENVSLIIVSLKVMFSKLSFRAKAAAIIETELISISRKGNMRSWLLSHLCVNTTPLLFN